MATLLSSVLDTVQAFHTGRKETEVQGGFIVAQSWVRAEQTFENLTLKTASPLPHYPVTVTRPRLGPLQCSSGAGSPRDLPADHQQVVEEEEVNFSEELLGPQGAGGLGAGHLLQLTLLQQPPGV